MLSVGFSFSFPFLTDASWLGIYFSFSSITKRIGRKERMKEKKIQFLAAGLKHHHHHHHHLGNNKS
jgi:hypothetical protein